MVVSRPQLGGRASVVLRILLLQGSPVKEKRIVLQPNDKDSVCLTYLRMFFTTWSSVLLVIME